MCAPFENSRQYWGQLKVEVSSLAALHTWPFGFRLSPGLPVTRCEHVVKCTLGYRNRFHVRYITEILLKRPLHLFFSSSLSLSIAKESKQQQRWQKQRNPLFTKLLNFNSGHAETKFILRNFGNNEYTLFSPRHHAIGCDFFLKVLNIGFLAAYFCISELTPLNMALSEETIVRNVCECKRAFKCKKQRSWYIKSCRLLVEGVCSIHYRHFC